MLNNRRRRPTHPGVLLAEILPASPIKNQANLASLMGVSRRLINEIINERMQIAIDVWEAAQENHKDYQRIRERAAKIAA
jgi:hypothetical protein